MSAIFHDSENIGGVMARVGFKSFAPGSPCLLTIALDYGPTYTLPVYLTPEEGELLVSRLQHLIEMARAYKEEAHETEAKSA